MALFILACMKKAEAPVRLKTTQLSPAIQGLRLQAPAFLTELRECSGITGTDQLLGGGKNSAIFWLRKDVMGHEVVKFDTRNDAIATKTAGDAWREGGVIFPRTKAYGTVPSTEGLPTPIQYQRFEGIANTKGNPADTVNDILQKDPSQIPTYAERIGEALAKMHKAPCSEAQFGSIHNTPITPLWRGEQVITSDTWNDFLLNFIDYHSIYLDMFTPRQQRAIKETISSLASVTKTYIHGDSSNLANWLVLRGDSVDCAPTDPTAFVGEKHWEIASYVNLMEIAQQLAITYPNNTTLQEEYKNTKYLYNFFIHTYQNCAGAIDLKLLLASRFAISLRALDWLSCGPAKNLSEDVYQQQSAVLPLIARTTGERLISL